MEDKIVISDLLDIIHYTIIKQLGENSIILQELSDIDAKIQSGKLPNLKIQGTPYWETIKNNLLK